MGITGAERVTSILDNVLSSAKEELLCAPDNVKGDYEKWLSFSSEGLAQPKLCKL